MATIDGIGLAEPSTITKSLAAVLIQRNTSNTYQEIMVIGDPDSTTSSAVMKVTNAAPASTAWGGVVRIASGPSSGADLLMRPVFSSTNTDNPVRAILSSTSADNPVTATFASSANTVQARLYTSSGGALEGALAPPAANALGLNVRTVLPTLVTVTSTAGTDTTITLISSAATTPRIVAYSVTSTAAGPIRAGFYAGSTLLWPVTLWADGGVVNLTEAVPAPAFIFSGQADRPVQFSQGSTGHVVIGLTYWQQ